MDAAQHATLQRVDDTRADVRCVVCAALAAARPPTCMESVQTAWAYPLSVPADAKPPTSRILLWCAYLLPLGYAARLLRGFTHEVLGHGLTATLHGGQFTEFVVRLDGSGWSRSSAPGHRVEVLAGGSIACWTVAGLLVIASLFLHRRLLLRGALLVLALDLAVSTSSSAFWDAVYMAGNGDTVRILSTAAWASYRPVAIGLLGALYVMPLAVICRMLVRTLEDDIGPLPVRAVVAISIAMVGGIALSSDLMPWARPIEGASYAPAVIGILLQVLVGVWLVLTRRHDVLAHPVSRRAWAMAIPLAWMLASAAVLVVALVLQHGVKLEP